MLTGNYTLFYRLIPGKTYERRRCASGSAGESSPHNEPLRSAFEERSAEHRVDRDSGDHAEPSQSATDQRNCRSAVLKPPTGSARGSLSVGIKLTHPPDCFPCLPRPQLDRDPEGIGTPMPESSLSQPHSIVYVARSASAADAASVPASRKLRR